jgi:hypothetical protein
MKKHLNNPWIVGVLVLIAVAVVADALMPAREETGEVPNFAHEHEAPLLTSPETAEAVSSSFVEIREALKELALSNALRDPFVYRPKEVAPVVLTEKTRQPDIVETIRLTALWTQGGRTWALINGRAHQAGDEIGRLTIETATPDGVWVTHWKGRDFVEIGAHFTLVTPAEEPKSLSSFN